MKNEKWFGLGISQVEKKLKTNAASGLSRKAARSRINRNAGSLFYSPHKPSPRLLLELLADFALIILLLAAIVSLFFEDGRLQGILVLVLTVGNLIVSWFMYYRSQRTVESLATFFYPVARVIRGGKLFHVDFRTVVPGDVILLEAGDIVCADARLVTSENLRVRMRLDKKNYLSLEKRAEGHVNPQEYHAKEMINMVHAGSIVEQGSARAIVTAVGRYTYLGAMTGGIPLPISSKTPQTIKRLRKHCSTINMISLIAVLPFSIISLLIGHLTSGNVYLSSTFLTALTLVATTMPQLGCTLSRLFYIHKIRHLVTSADASAIKSVEALDKLASVDYVFLLDGGALTDGILHYHSAVCADGEIRNFSAMTQSAKRFCDLVSLYHTAATRTLTTGVSGAGKYFAGIREFLDKSGVDETALQIRCPVFSYSPGNLIDSSEVVYYTENGVKYCLSVSHSPKVISECGYVMVGIDRQRLSIDGIKNLETQWQKYREAHGTPLIFTITSEQSPEPCFVGFLLLKEGIDPNWAKNMTRMEKMGCNVIAFARNQMYAPNIPNQITVGRSYSKNEFLKNKLPLTYQFGKIRVYSDFENEDILSLIEYVHRQKKSVAVVGFTESALEIASLADAFVTCAPVHSRTTGYLDEEIRTMELAGQQYSTSCTQVVKEKADCLIPRPTGGKGGLASLALTVEQVKSAYHNLSGFIRYMVYTQIIRLLVTAVPVLLGSPVLDARHLLFCSCVLDLFALLCFLGNKNSSRAMGAKNYCAISKIGDYISGDMPLLISCLCSGATLLLPKLLELLSLAGRYHIYETETFFTALILLHLTVLFFVFYGTNLRHAKKIHKNKTLIAESTVAFLFLLSVFLWKDFGGLFGIDNTLSVLHIFLALLPSCVFVGVMLYMTYRKTGKSSDVARKKQTKRKS